MKSNAEIPESYCTTEDVLGPNFFARWAPPHIGRWWWPWPTRGERKILERLESKELLLDEKTEDNEQALRELELERLRGNRLKSDREKFAEENSSQAQLIKELQSGTELFQVRHACQVLHGMVTYLTSGIRVLAHDTRRRYERAGFNWPPVAAGEARVWKRVLRILDTAFGGGANGPPRERGGGGTGGANGGPVVLPQRRSPGPKP